MKWVFGVILLAFAAPAAAQNKCPPARPRPLVSGVTPVIGQSPVWATTGTGLLVWEGPDKPVPVVWLRDLAVRGAASLSGQLRETPATKVRFSTRGSTLGLQQQREERYRLEGVGVTPASVRPDDLTKYSFFQTDVWFPVAGCYEITGRVGREQSVITFAITPRGAR